MWEPGFLEGEWLLVFPGGFILRMGPEDVGPEQQPVVTKYAGRRSRDGTLQDAEDPPPG